MDRYFPIKVILFIAALILCMMVPGKSSAERVKDITTMQGVRGNQLLGYGLVVGLDGTGDQITQAKFTEQSFRSMLNKFGINVPNNISIKSNNIAAVMVSAELPAFSKPGQTIDITASSIGNAKSLRGGTLLMTPLKAADGKVYAVAQGNLIVSGLGAEGADGSRITVNIPSVGRIPNGAYIERPSPTLFSYEDTAIFNLHSADFTTAVRIADSINRQIGHEIATPMDATSIKVHLPHSHSDQLKMIANIENINVRPGEAAARIVVNSRTGTVIIGQHVAVMPAAVSHGTLTVTISEAPFASQPNPFSLGTTTTVQDSQLQVQEEDNRAFLFDPGPSLNDLVQAVNNVGASPSDLVAILESLKAVGALRGELVVI